MKAKNIQMNASVSSSLRDRIQELSADVGLTASDAMSLLPWVLYEHKKECMEYARKLATGEPTFIPMAYLLTYFKIDTGTIDYGCYFSPSQDLSFENQYRHEWLSIDREYECTLIDSHIGTVFIGDVYDDKGVGSVDKVFTLKSFWSNIQKHFKDSNGLWIEDVPFVMGNKVVLTFKKGNK
jgi:hypothetical protein